jgi:hypothetical protein
MTSKLGIPLQTLPGAVLVILAIFLFSGASAQALTTTPRLELNGDPGQILHETIRVQNEERQSRTYYISFANFLSADEEGHPSFSPRLEDLATWINAPASITLGPLEEQQVPITVTIPRDAEPGGHFSAVFFDTLPPAQEGGKVSIATKLATLVLLRVSGNFTQAANILEFATLNHQKFFTSLPIGFYYRFQNTGDDFLKPLGDVLIRNMFGSPSKIIPANPIDGSVLPKSIRRFTTVWVSNGKPLAQDPVVVVPEGPQGGFFSQAQYQLSNLAFGRYTAQLKLAFGTKALQSDTAFFSFYIIPWQLLTIVIVVLLVAIIVFRLFIKRYNRRVIEQARRRGKIK